MGQQLPIRWCTIGEPDCREAFIDLPEPPYFGWVPYHYACEKGCDECYNVIKGVL